MIRILTAAALAPTALTGAAHANIVLSPGQIAQIERFAPGADLTNLSDARKAAIVSVLYSGGDSAGEKGSTIRGLVQ
jgi:hypothetical protein